MRYLKPTSDGLIDSRHGLETPEYLHLYPRTLKCEDPEHALALIESVVSYEEAHSSLLAEKTKRIEYLEDLLVYIQEAFAEGDRARLQIYLEEFKVSSYMSCKRFRHRV